MSLALGIRLRTTLCNHDENTLTHPSQTLRSRLQFCAFYYHFLSMSFLI